MSASTEGRRESSEEREDDLGGREAGWARHRKA